MTEVKTGKRGWVKNAVIIFLAVMLVLTFFSNTIMNWSLPEVAVQTAMSGDINAQIMGTGTVKAASTYEVKAEESRKVQTVYAQEGSAVTAGDILFVYTAGGSEELKAAQERLEELQLEYKRSQLQAQTFDYTRQERDIEELREKIAEAIALRDSLIVSDEDYAAAENAVAQAKDTVKEAEDTVKKAEIALEQAQNMLGSVNQGNGDYSGVESAMLTLEAARADLEAAKNALATAQLTYGAVYDALVAETDEWIAVDYDAQNGEGAFAAMDVLQQNTVLAAKRPIYLPATAAKYAPDSAEAEAYGAITQREAAIAAANAQVRSAELSYSQAVDRYYSENAGNSSYYEYKKAYDEATETLSAAQKRLLTTQEEQTRAEARFSQLKDDRAACETAEGEIKTLEDSLDDKLFDLNEQKKTDSVAQKLQELDFQKMRDDIAKQEELIKSYETGEAVTEVKAEVNGVVKSVGVTAGSTTKPEDVLATIEVPDMGYTVELTVTAEQAQKVVVGDMAQVSMGWWGSYDITAQLTAIRPDPKNPRTNKILVFEVSGSDVSSGSNIDISIGERSRMYDIVVPKSALRSDSNGSFVLIVVAKPSPLGNRYTAQRVDVTVQAEDDVNCAVTGGVGYGDYVITTSTIPVESGMQIRMAEG